MNIAYRKGIRRGLGMRPRDFVSERFPGYIESSVKMKKHPIQFLRRATQSGNRLVSGLSGLICRYSFPGHVLDMVQGNIFASKYDDLKSL